MPLVTAEEVAEMRAKGELSGAPQPLPRSKEKPLPLAERVERLEVQRAADELVGPPPPVVQHIHEAPRPVHQTLVDVSTKKSSLYGPAEAPIVSAVAGSPSVAQWRVWRDVEGVRTYLGTIASHATPEALIRRFPGAMPTPGTNGLFLLRALTPEGKETGSEIPFTISGDAPAVIEARRALSGAPSSSSASPALDAALAALLERQAEAAKDALNEAREEARRVAVALAAERRELADRLAQAERERAERARSDAELAIARIREEARIAADAERERRRQDREDLEARYRADREERERREAREREERQERERERERMLQAERERDREHQQRLASLTAASSLESTVAKAGTLLGALGLKPADLFSKLLGGGEQPVVGESTAAVIGGVVSTLVNQIGEVVKTQMEIQARMAGEDAAPAQRPAPRQITQRAPVAPAPAAPPKAPATEPEKKEEPVVNAALNAILMPVQRKARNALRALAERLQTLEEEKWQAEVIQAVTKSPEILPYVKAVGLKKAATEAGMSEEQADKIVAAVPQGVL